MKQKEELTKQRDSQLDEIVTVRGDQSHQNVYGGSIHSLMYFQKAEIAWK